LVKSRLMKKRQFQPKRASSNWFDLKKLLEEENVPCRKRKPKLSSGKRKDAQSSSEPPPGPVPSTSTPSVPEHLGSHTNQGDAKDRACLGRYLAIDCEMVGVGINASESSLARISLVDYHGAVIMDKYVKQRDRVVDYRTRWSGIRASDMVDAHPFEDVQKAVSDLLEGRILIGHAVHHDLKALLLSHPTRQTRDTQQYAYKFALTKTPRISLKHLAKQELGIKIQTGEHSSVEDARATMAIYRLHKKDWERASEVVSQISEPETAKRKRSELDGEPLPLAEEISSTLDIHRKKRAKKDKDPTSSLPGGGRKGVSSGLSTVVRHGGQGAAVDEPLKNKHAWWKSISASG